MSQVAESFINVARDCFAPKYLRLVEGDLDKDASLHISRMCALGGKQAHLFENFMHSYVSDKFKYGTKTTHPSC